MNREFLKKIYKEKRLKDGKEVGVKLHALFQVLHAQTKLKNELRDKELIKSTLAEITEIRKTKRFREEFPSFASFRSFVVENDVTAEELKEV